MELSMNGRQACVWGLTDRMKVLTLFALLATLVLSCRERETFNAGTYGYGKTFLSQHVDHIELSNGKSKVLIVPAYQARVMTSSCQGDTGAGFGWINYSLISSGKTGPHMNAFGGEERLWLGPEGGQYSIFFPPDVPYTFEHWQTPAFLDIEPFTVVHHSADSAAFVKDFQHHNRAGFLFKGTLERRVRILGKAEVARRLGSAAEAVSVVAYESVNILKNRSGETWDKANGLLSIWMLGMMNPSPGVTVVLPIEPGPARELGEPVISDYFGSIPSDRLIVTDSAIFFRADGNSAARLAFLRCAQNDSSEVTMPSTTC